MITAWREQGFARAGKLLSDDLLAALRARADELMLGQAPREGIFFQHDSESGDYFDIPRGQGFVGPSLRYRKLEKLERDPVFLRAVLHPALVALARAALGPELQVCRAALFVKAARGGTQLPWHQDAGRFWGLSKDPSFQIWTALDDAPVESGCLQLVPQSHLGGLARPMGGMITEAMATASSAAARAVLLPASAGESVVIHNLCWHRSGVNATDLPRRALTVCFIDGVTKCTRKKSPRAFLRVPDLCPAADSRVRSGMEAL